MIIYHFYKVIKNLVSVLDWFLNIFLGFQHRPHKRTGPQGSAIYILVVATYPLTWGFCRAGHKTKARVVLYCLLLYCIVFIIIMIIVIIIFIISVVNIFITSIKQRICIYIIYIVSKMNTYYLYIYICKHKIWIMKVSRYMKLMK